MDKYSLTCNFIYNSVRLKKDLPVFKNIKPFQLRRVMSSQRRSPKAHDDLLDSMCQRSSLSFGIMALHVEVNVIDVLFSVVEKKYVE
jgi:hypothetical protein